MPNRVRNETIKIRNQTLADLKRIYAAEWSEISEDVERLVNEMWLDPEDSTQAERLRHAERNGKRDRLIDTIVAAVILANTRAIARINSGVGRIYTINANDVISYTFERTGVMLSAKDADVNSLIGKYTQRRYDRAVDNKYVSRQVMREITDMLKEGKGTREIARRLRKVYGFNRTSAFRTTLTETTRMQSRGRLDTMNEAAKRGLIYQKIWRHGVYVKDPRDWHVDMDGEVRDRDKPFSNGAMAPGLSGDPQEDINCHCFLDEDLIEW